MKLAHYSDKLISKIKKITPGPRLDGMKPTGLWVSDDSAECDWLEWCVGESFGLERFRWRTEVYIKPDANILFVKSVSELKAFHEEYKLPLYLGAPVLSEVIDWARVAEKYDGIIISPYQWELRLSWAIWYYCWDCASGCIWNADAIELRPSEPFDIDDYAKRKASGREEAA